VTLREGELESAADMEQALRAGDVDSAELVERALRRAEAWQPSINAFSQELWSDQAMDEAGRIDRTSLRERPRLAGVPIVVKDLFDVAGMETSGCCAAYRGTVAERDSPVIERIRGAGLVMIGKANQHELAAGGTNLVSACGRAGNPWDPDRMTGGSSGGSAAAVAAGIVPWALGSDTGGSIRIPGSMCGVWGLKPTTGTIPLEGVMPLAPSMDVPGPIAGTLDDLFGLYDVMAGVSWGEERRSASSGGASGSGLRVGMPDGFFQDRIHDQVLGAVSAAGEALEAAGVVVEPLNGTGLTNVRFTWMAVCCPEFADEHPLLKDPEKRKLVAPQVVAWLDLGESQSPEGRAQAVVERERIARWFGEALDGPDALLIPTTPYPAPRANQSHVELGTAGTVEVDHVGPGWITCSVNLAGLPAISLPAGRSSDGMPIGVSLVGRAGAEHELVRLAAVWAVSAGYAPARLSLPDSSKPGPGR
jgi:Asp-tRNA(Asn)/Glu-tRNA(Gln) amidotransferase A subunit family amidase